jgi:hypothetical protein
MKHAVKELHAVCTSYVYARAVHGDRYAYERRLHELWRTAGCKKRSQ